MSKPQILRIDKPLKKVAAPAAPIATAQTPPPQEPPTPGSAGREWWAQRWIDVLESFGWRRRLERARVYAREGRVQSLEFRGPQVVAKVQGTAPEPYNVKLSLDAFSDEQWQYAIEEMSRRAIFAAKLLVGEMPQNIEEAFIASGLSLFPFSKFDIHSRCSCPDPVNPCKHIGAVYYLLGDAFSRDPFILFQLRGKTRQEIITTLRQLRSAAPGGAVATATPAVPQSTPVDLGPGFWQYTQPLDPALVVIVPPPAQETVLDVLGPIPLDPSPGCPQSPQLLMDSLQKIYQQVRQQTLMSAMRLGEE